MGRSVVALCRCYSPAQRLERGTAAQPDLDHSCAGRSLRFCEKPSLVFQISQSGWRKALLALTCCMVLLFPIISASDDLHPVQAAVEDASKRVQLVLEAGSTVRTATPVAAILFAVFATYLLFAFSASWCRRPRATRVRLLDGERFPVPGRGPPSVL